MFKLGELVYVKSEMRTGAIYKVIGFVGGGTGEVLLFREAFQQKRTVHNSNLKRV